MLSAVVRKSRGLRVRLTAAYALFLSLLLIFSAVVFRQFLATSQNQQAQESLDQQWVALKGYLRIDRGSVSWYVDMKDRDEVRIGAELQQTYILATVDGAVKNETPEFKALNVDSGGRIRDFVRTGQPIWTEAATNRGVPYLVRSGLIADESTDDQYYVAIARSLANNRKILSRYTLLSATLVPLMILSGCVIGWVLSGRGLAPVLDVAKTAQRIGGSNLSLRIPMRRAGDELDFLIETFNQMIERLENSFQQIRQFSTDVSHELRTPITIIRGQLEVALFTAQTKEQYHDAIVDSLQDIERLSQIVRALLLLSQAETGQVVLAKALLDLSEVVRDICDQFQIPAEGAQVKLTCSTGERCMADLDRVQIERMLSNLLSNAIKFTPPGGEVQTSLTCHGDQAVVTVRDTGCGINPRHLPHIFDRFYRAGSQDNSPSPEKGLGLGLSFVAWIAKAHQGTVTVDSVPGEGTGFTVTLPCSAPPELKSAPPEEYPLLKKV